METKQKTWEDIFKESAELFNSSTAEERDRLKEQFDKSFILGCQLTKQNNDLKEENERLKKSDQYVLGHTDGFVDGTKELDSLKQLNSELVKSLDEIIRYYERHYRVPYVWQPYKMAKEAFSKASDRYTKAKD